MDTILTLYQKQLQSNPAEKVILRQIDSSLACTTISWGNLEAESNRCAACLMNLGCLPTDRVLICLRSPFSIWTFFLGALKCGAVPCVLFPNFGSEALLTRLKSAEANFLIADACPSATSMPLNELPSLKWLIFLRSEGSEINISQQAVIFEAASWPDSFLPAVVQPEDPAFMVFTSGSTGQPKAVVHMHQIAESIERSMRNVLHARPDDVYWCTAHPAWITGTVYGILGPLLSGVESIQYSGNFHFRRWMPVLQDQRVSLWYSAPTAFRALMKEPDEAFTAWDFSSLRQIYSIGEPLNPDVFEWGERVFHQEILDTWFQTETGTIRIANQPGVQVKPGSMGKAVDDARPLVLDKFGKKSPANLPGNLHLQVGWQSCFKGYFDQQDATNRKLCTGFYETGDMAELDADGYYWFLGRNDDVINTSGHLVGPFEVESALLREPEIVEAAVVGIPDDLVYEKPAAFLVLREGTQWGKELETRLRVRINSSVSPYAVPKEFFIVESLPHTPSGKIRRAELRNKFL